MNIWNFTGRIGKDAELRFLPNGDPVASFSVAVDFGYGDKKGTIWARCSGYGKRYEAVSKYLLKGAQVAISGELSERKWTDKQGVEKVIQEVRVSELTLIGGKPENAPKPKQYSKAGPDIGDGDNMPW